MGWMLRRGCGVPTPNPVARRIQPFWSLTEAFVARADASSIKGLSFRWHEQAQSSSSMPDSCDTPMHPNFGLRPPHLNPRILLGRFSEAAVIALLQPGDVARHEVLRRMLRSPSSYVCHGKFASHRPQACSCRLRCASFSGGLPHATVVVGTELNLTAYVRRAAVGALLFWGVRACAEFGRTAGRGSRVDHGCMPSKARACSTRNVAPRTKESLVNWHPANAGRVSR